MSNEFFRKPKLLKNRCFRLAAFPRITASADDNKEIALRSSRDRERCDRNDIFKSESVRNYAILWKVPSLRFAAKCIFIMALVLV